MTIRTQSGLLLVAMLAAAPEATASLTSCATAWSNFTGPNGFVRQYTYLGADIRDYEAAGAGGDPTNGGTGVNPNSIDISSASPASPPGPESSVAFGYYNGGTPWSPTDPATLEDDSIFFRMRIGADPRDNSTVGFNSYHWNILFDLNADGYKDYWIDVDGGYGNNGNPDRVQILYDARHSQLITDLNTARVDQFTAHPSVDTSNCGGAGTSHTQAYPVGDGSGDWYLEIQVPMTALNDRSGNQLLFPDSPVAFVYTTGASNQDPLQKDHMMDLSYVSAADPVTFGDLVTPSGLPAIDFTDSALRPAGYYMLGGEVFLSVTDRLADVNLAQPDCIIATVTDPVSGDDEPVRLCETGPSTGLFTNRGAISAVTPARNGPTATGWLAGLQSTTATLAAQWQLVYESASGGQWAVRYFDGTVWTTLPARAHAGTAYTAVVDSVAQLTFTVQESGPQAGDTISFATMAGQRLPTAVAPTADGDGVVASDSGRTLYVSYTNVGHYTVTDSIPVIGPCGALVQFTRSNGRVTSDYNMTSDPGTGDALYLTVTAPAANTNPATVQAITIVLASTRPGGDGQALTLTETGPNTGIFRNTAGLPTVVASTSYPVTPGNGRWEDVDQGAVTASYGYACGGAQTASTTATLFSTPGGGRVAFTNSAGTADVGLYTPGAPIWVQLIDPTVSSGCVTPPYASGTVRVTVRSSTGDAETLTLYETAPGSGVFRNQRYDLVTAAGTASVSSASTSFAGAPAMAIATGPDVGTYAIESGTGGSAILDRRLSATRTGIAFAISPLRALTYAGGTPAPDNRLEAVHDGDVRVEYTDCNDGDSDATNNVKVDTAKYNAPALVINRVLFAPAAPSPSQPPGVDPVGSNCQQEMVEVYNQTATAVDATGYVLRNGDQRLDYTVPQLGGSDIVLAPAGKIVLSIGGYYRDFQAGPTFYLFTGDVNADGTLPNWLHGPLDPDPADQITLYDRSMKVVDYVGWSGTATPSTNFLGGDSAAVVAGIWQDDAYVNTADLPLGQAIARTADGVDTNTPRDWSVVGDSTCDAMISAYAVTRATVRGLRVDPAGLVEFATGTQSGSRSFRVFGVLDPDGVRRVPLHDRPVPAVVSDSVTPILYRVETAPIETPFVSIEETDVHGATRLMGPFPVEGARLRAQLQWIEARLDRAGVRTDLGPRVATGTSQPRLMQALGRTARPADHRLARAMRRVPAGPARGVKVRVRGAGDVFVPVDALRARGLAADPRRLQVTVQGQAVPFQAGADGIRFRAQKLSTDWTDANVYVLSSSGAPGASVPLSRSGDAPWPRWTRVEKSYAYVPSLPREADPWQWDLLLTGVGTWPYGWWDPSVGQFDLPGFRPTRGDVRVALRLVGFSDHTHAVQARINGVAIGSVTFEGRGLALLEGSVPSAALQAEGNRLELDYDADVADPATEYGMVYFDHLDLAYAPTPASGAAAFEVLPWDPTCPVRGVDYLVVTHADFAEAAGRIARAKSAEGLRAAVVDVERAYDAYSGGVPEPNAVAALVRDFAAQGGRYVLLVGDDTFDPRDYAGTGAASFVPSAIRFDEVWGRVPSENGYADVEGDGRPEVAIGRLPVQTPEEASLLADKVVHERERLADVAGRQLIAVDNRGPGDPPFQKDAGSVPATRGTTVAWSRVADGIDAARQELFAGFAAGAQVTHYFGHGGPEVWADEQLLTVADVASLPASPPTVLFTWACQSQWYLNLWGPSLNEALLLRPDGGAVASFGPAGITTPRQQEGLARGVYTRFLVAGMSLGDAVREAKREALAADPSTRAAVDGWNLLGDPALVLPGR